MDEKIQGKAYGEFDKGNSFSMKRKGLEVYKFCEFEDPYKNRHFGARSNHEKCTEMIWVPTYEMSRV